MTYRVILADPPWQYRVWTDKDSRTADSQYSVMTTGEICALPIADLAAENCALYLWATPPTIQCAFEVMEAWGFTYKTFGFMWVKHNAHPIKDYSDQKDPCIWRPLRDAQSGLPAGGYRPSTGMGSHTRANVEPCLLGIRGKGMRPDDKAVSQLVLAPRPKKHSEKPREVHERLERMYPGGPFVELFARSARKGWDVWGDEVESTITL